LHAVVWLDTAKAEARIMEVAPPQNGIEMIKNAPISELVAARGVARQSCCRHGIQNKDFQISFIGLALAQTAVSPPKDGIETIRNVPNSELVAARE
jgi:hypothetical protein